MQIDLKPFNYLETALFVPDYSCEEKALRENKKEPTIDEIAKELGVEKEEIAFCLDAIQDPVSLQEPVYGDDTEK